MSEATLRQFLERMNEDAAFRESVQANPESAMAQFALSPAEQAALSSGDEDALRRLAGADASGFMLPALINSEMACPQPALIKRTTTRYEPECSPYPVPATAFPRCK